MQPCFERGAVSISIIVSSPCNPSRTDTVCLLSPVPRGHAPTVHVNDIDISRAITREREDSISQARLVVSGHAPWINCSQMTHMGIPLETTTLKRRKI
jgi:hypothetical protein